MIASWKFCTESRLWDRLLLQGRMENLNLKKRKLSVVHILGINESKLYLLLAKAIQLVFFFLLIRHKCYSEQYEINFSCMGETEQLILFASTQILNDRTMYQVFSSHLCAHFSVLFSYSDSAINVIVDDHFLPADFDKENLATKINFLTFTY